MRSPSGLEHLADRYGQYIGELHVFLGSCDVAFGSPADILPFATRLAEPGYLRDGIRAMIRAVIYREQESISHLELLELILLAVGGPEIEPDAPELQQAERILSRVIGQAMTSLWTVPNGTAQLHPIPRESLESLQQPAPEPAATNSGPQNVWQKVMLAEAEQSVSTDAPLEPQQQAEPEASIAPPIDLPAQAPTGPATPVEAHTEIPASPLPDAPATLETPPQVPATHVTAAETAPVTVAPPRVAPVAPSWAPPPPSVSPPVEADAVFRARPGPPPETKPDPSPLPSRGVAASLPPPLLWIAALCALLLAPAISLLAHHKPAPAAPAPHPRVRRYTPPIPSSFTSPTPAQPTASQSLFAADQTGSDSPGTELRKPRGLRTHTGGRRSSAHLSSRPQTSQPASQVPASPPAWATEGARRETDMPGPDRTVAPTPEGSSSYPASRPEAAPGSARGKPDTPEPGHAPSR